MFRYINVRDLVAEGLGFTVFPILAVWYLYIYSSPRHAWGGYEDYTRELPCQLGMLRSMIATPHLVFMGLIDHRENSTLDMA